MSFLGYIIIICFILLMIPIINDTSNICRVDDTPFIIYKFPVHIIKLIGVYPERSASISSEQAPGDDDD